MKVARWGNSLAIRIPADVARALSLEEGDAVELTPKAPGEIEVSKSEKRAQALEAIRSLRGSFPADFKFDREEANAR